MSKQARRWRRKKHTEIPATAVRLAVALDAKGKTIRLSLAAVEVLACLTTQICGAYGAKKQAIAHDICKLPLYGFDFLREFAGWAPTDIVKEALKELRIFFRQKEIVGVWHCFDVGHDPDPKARKMGQSQGYALVERANVWTQAFLEDLTPAGCEEWQNAQLAKTGLRRCPKMDELTRGRPEG